jgi:hypothetical protein
MKIIKYSLPDKGSKVNITAIMRSMKKSKTGFRVRIEDFFVNSSY